jgi:hypothetical protein
MDAEFSRRKLLDREQLRVLYERSDARACCRRAHILVPYC